MQYEIQESGSTQTTIVPGSATTETTVSGLHSATDYSIEVAAVNRAGIGAYSASLFVVTSGKMYGQVTLV